MIHRPRSQALAAARALRVWIVGLGSILIIGLAVVWVVLRQRIQKSTNTRFDGDRITECGIGLGGVATVALRMHSAESILTGAALTDEMIYRAAAACTEGATPLPETGYKVDLVKATVQETLERLRIV